jgi:uncharacterized repeat protein (TIGR01451 family)
MASAVRAGVGPVGASRLLAFAIALAACLALPSSAAAQGAPVGCGYGVGGPFASNLCWFDMSGYNDTLARSLAGQPMSVSLPGGYTATFTLTSRPVSGVLAHPGIESRSVPIAQRFAFGKAGYVGTPGNPVLYSLDAGSNGVELRLSDISVVDALGAPVTGYSFVVADAENNINGESFTWNSDKPLDLVGVLNPDPPRGCQDSLTGLGTTSVTCTGQGTDPPGAGGSTTPLYDNVIVGADTPSTIGLSLRTFARSGVAFAIMTSKIEVAKSVVGRVRGSDSFDVSARSPEGSTIASASTGSGGSATTGELTVLPRTNGSSYTLAETATPGSGTLLSDYGRSWSCTNNGAPDPSLPSGSGTSVVVSPAAGDDISCTVTNTQLPAELSVDKSVASPPAVPGTRETFRLVVANDGPSRATDVHVSDSLPSGMSFVSASPGCAEDGGTVTCTVDSLPAGESRTFEVDVELASSADRCAELSNTATVTSDTPDSDADDDSSTVCPTLEGRTDLSIVKTVSDEELPVGGGQVMYTLVVRNDGPSDATGVTVDDSMAPGLSLVAADASQGSCTTVDGRLSCSLGRLAPDTSAQVLVTAHASATPRSIVNTATISGVQSETDPDDNSDSATVTVPPAPAPPTPQPPEASPFDLVVTKAASKRRVAVGQRVKYRVVVANRGPAAAPDVRLTDTLNAPVSVMSVKTSAGSCRRRIPMRCSLGTIASGGRVTIAVVARHRGTGCRQRNAASATGAGTDADPASNLTTVGLCAAKARLRLSKVADRRAVRAGDRIAYTIRVANPSMRTARNVRICDRLPAGLVYVGSRSRARLRGGAWCWRAKRLAAGASKRYRITVRALPGARGRKVNRATVNGVGDVRAARTTRAVRVRPAVARGGGVTG